MSLPANTDAQRLYHLYHYLCTCLAITHKQDGTPNFTGISNRLSENKDFRKTVSLLFQGEGAWVEKTVNSKKISATTGQVVKMLARLNTNLKQDYQSGEEESYTRVLTLSDILTAISKLIELTPQERHSLGMPTGDGLTLLQRTLLIVQVVDSLDNYEMLLRIYKAAVGLDFTNSALTLNNLAEVDRLIAETVTDALSYLPQRRERRRNAGISPGNIVLERNCPGGG